MAPSRSSASRGFLVLLGGFFLLSLLGGMIAEKAAALRPATDPTVPFAPSFYLYTFTRFEPAALFSLAAFFFLAFLLAGHRTPEKKLDSGLLASARLGVPVALLVLLAAIAGRFEIYQNFDLCIDEALNGFEVQILNRHHVVAAVPEAWRSYENALAMPYQRYNAAGHYWASGFLPGFAFLDYLFSAAHLDWALSPVLAALSILLVSALAERIFVTNGRLAANLAVLLLAASPQFMATAMTQFAWTAHLCGTLLWLWLLTHPNRFLFLCTPILGALLIGLHQPHVHVLVAAPFVLRLAFERRWGAVLWFGLWYVIGAIVWYQVLLLLRPSPLAAGGDLANFAQPPTQFLIPLLLAVAYSIFNTLTTLAWSTPLLLPLAVVMLLTWKQQPVLLRDSFLAVAITFLFYLFFPRPQGHGWGYRYLHSVYGLVALVAAGGAWTLYRRGVGPGLGRAIAAGLLFSLLVQFPYRACEIRSLVRPLSLAWNYISQQRCDFVVLRTSDFWYSWDLVRNDPWLERRPLIFNDDKLTPAQRAALAAQGTIRVVGAKEVAPFGVILSDPQKMPSSH